MFDASAAGSATATTKRRSLLASAFHQGEFDGLCGVYAIINALRVAATLNGELQYSACEELFRLAITFLATEDHVATAVRWGVGLPLWRRLCEHLLACAAPLSGQQFVALRLVESDRATDTVDETIDFFLTIGIPVIALIRGPYSHFTVLTHRTEARLMLADSLGLHWVPKRAVAAPPLDKRSRRIEVASLTAIAPNGVVLSRSGATS